jgi:hypothetical protein
MAAVVVPASSIIVSPVSTKTAAALAILPFPL